MADVVMSYESLSNAATQVNKAKTDLEEVILFLDNAIKALEGNYSGQSYQALVNAWTSSKPTMKKLSEAVGNFAPALNKAVERQREAEGISAGGFAEASF